VAKPSNGDGTIVQEKPLLQTKVIVLSTSIVNPYAPYDCNIDTYRYHCRNHPSYCRRYIATERHIERRSGPPVVCNKLRRLDCRDRDSNGRIHSRHAADADPGTLG